MHGKCKMDPQYSHDDLENFRNDIRELLKEWYRDCPNKMRVITGLISAYKTRFPNDNFMKEL